MTEFRVFVGAPPPNALQQESTPYHWQSVSSLPSPKQVVIPPSTLNAASQRISLLYQNVIFDQVDERHSQWACDDKDPGLEHITWISSSSTTSFLNKSSTRLDQSQDTEPSDSYNYSFTSSIACFPTFHFNLNSLTPLSSLTPEPRKVAVLLAILELEGVSTVSIKRGHDAGKEVSILNMILGDEDGHFCKLTAWREIAEAWGGLTRESPAIRRGDIVFINGVMASYSPSTSTAATLTASPYMKSTLEICYRTMPSTREDSHLRPDLRLGKSDIAVRKVATVVSWFEAMAGLAD